MDSSSSSFTVQPQTPRLQIRHRSSLEHVLTFTLRSPAPAPHEVTEATLLYHLILDDCEAANIVLRKPAGDGDRERANLSDLEELDEIGQRDEINVDNHDHDTRDEDEIQDGSSAPLHKLFRALYDYSPTADGRVNLIRIALHGLFPVPNFDDPDERALCRILPRARLWVVFTPDQKEQVFRTLAVFACEFLEGFFVPLKAQGRCTPAVSQLITPTSRTEVGPEQGTPTRLHDLRSLCLARDGNRCVVTQMYDSKYLKSYFKRTGRKVNQTGIKTEAAHIIPHALNALTGSDSDLHSSKRTVWRILNMFDPGTSARLSGTRIDTPMNAMMLAPELHDRFGSLECYFEAAPAHALNAYTFHTTKGSIPLPSFFRPPTSHVVFTNHERSGAPADLPCAKLLALHRACCLMLSMSGAAGYVENLLHDTETMMQKGVLAEDGSSNVALFLRMRGLREMEEDELERGLLAAVMAH